MTRDEYLAWAKARALEYLDSDQIGAAAASLLSDLRKHDELRAEFAHPAMLRAGTFACLKGDEAVREWIRGFV